MNPATIEIFGFRVSNVTIGEAVDAILDQASRGIRENIYFVNAHCVNTAAEDPGYREVMSRADHVFADGVGLALAAKFAGESLRDNVNGTDLFPELCEKAAQNGTPIAFLGGRKDVVTRCARRMTSRYPGLQIVCALDGYFAREEEEAVIETINNSGAQILLVAKGMPRQEMWIDRVSDRLQIPQVMAVGGLFDFYSGRFIRAPHFLRKLGLEWLFRLAQEPRRLFKRYVIGNPVFLYRTLRLRLEGRSTIREKLTLTQFL